MSFREKISIAKKLKSARGNYIAKSYRRMCLVVYRAYVLECIIKGKTNFTVNFKGRYIRRFSKRFGDWVGYFFESIYRLLLMIRYPKAKNLSYDQDVYKNLSSYHHHLIVEGAYKPKHIKVTNPPNEAVLTRFLNENGFELVDQVTKDKDVIYAVSPIRDYC